MPAERFELRLSFKRLLVGLLVTVVPISLAGLYAITKSDRELRHTVGTHFKIFAESTATEVSSFIHECVLHVGAMSVSNSILEAVRTANRSYDNLSEQAIGARVDKVESGWNTGASGEVVDRVLSSPAAATLRRHQEIDPRFLRITVTDVRGATVAATHKTLDYLQSDEDFWQAIYASGRGALSLTDVLYDDVTMSYYIGIGVPIVEPGTNRFLGALDALVDVSSLFRVVNRSHDPLNLRTSLVKDDGTVICAPEATLAAKMRSEEFVAVQDAMRSIEGRQTGYVITSVTGLGNRVIGFADTGLKEDYRNLGWIVLVSQDARQALASIRMVGRLTGFLAFIGLAMVALLAVYFSLHRSEPFESMHPMAEAPEVEPVAEEREKESARE